MQIISCSLISFLPELSMGSKASETKTKEHNMYFNQPWKGSMMLYIHVSVWCVWSWVQLYMYFVTSSTKYFGITVNDYIIFRNWEKRIGAIPFL